jgi:glycosyltransferase involved in cell wall biosynthesis
MTQDLESPAGVGRYFPLAKALSRLGYSVVISALHGDYKRAGKKSFTLDGVEINYVSQMHVLKHGDTKTYFNTLQLLYVTLKATLRLIQSGLEEKPDALLVCKTQPMNGLAAWFIHKLRGTPVYLDSDDYETLNNRFTGQWQQKVVGWFEDWMPSFANGIAVSTMRLSRRFQSLGYPTDHIHIIPHAFDQRSFDAIFSTDIETILADLREKYGIKNQDRVIVYVGSLSLVNHAIDLLLGAFAKLIPHDPTLVLLLVGGGEDIENIHHYAEDLDIAQHVRFTGRIKSDMIPFHYRLGNISVNPLPNSETAQYSLPIKLVESLAAEVPCVTTDIGDSKAFIGDAGIAVNPGDVDAFANGIRQILDDPNKAQLMRSEAKKLRMQASWDERVKDYIQVFQNLSFTFDR